MSIEFSAADERIASLIERAGLPGVAVCALGPDGARFEKGLSLIHILTLPTKRIV